MGAGLASLLPHALTPADWANAAATRAGIPLTQAQTQGVQANTQATQLQNQATQRQVASQQALQQYLIGQSGTVPSSGLPTAPGQQPNPSTTAPPNAPAPPAGGYPVMPSGLIDRTGAGQPQPPANGSANIGGNSAPTLANAPAMPASAPGLPPRAMPQQPQPPQQPPANMPGGMGGPMGGYPSGIFNTGAMARLNILPSDIFGLQNQAVGAATKYQELSDKQRADYDRRAADASQLLVGIHGADQATQDQQWPAYVAAVQKADASHPEFAVGAPPPPTLPQDPQAREQLIRAQLGSHNVLGQVLANAKSSADTAAQTAEAGLNTAKTPGAAATSQIEQNKAALQTEAVNEFRKNPQSGGNVIDAVLPANLDPTANASYKNAIGVAMKYGGPDAAQKVIEEATAHAAAIGAQTSPTVIAAKGATAAAEEKGRAPYQQGVETSVAAFRNRLDQGNTARGLYNGSLQTYNEAQGVQQTFHRMLDLAGQGNAVAASQIKAMLPELVNSVQGIKRLSASQGNQEMGNAADVIGGKLNQYLNGVPYNKTVLAELGPTIDTLASSAAHAHNLNVRGINATYSGSGGTNFPAVQEAAPAAPKGTPSPASTPHVSNKAQFDALASGATYIGTDGGHYRKP